MKPPGYFFIYINFVGIEAERCEAENKSNKWL